MTTTASSPRLAVPLPFRVFCTSSVRLDGAPVRFDRRPYLEAIHDVHDRNVILRTSRQVEKSTYLNHRVVHHLVSRPGSAVIYVVPREQQARSFANTRVHPAILESPLVRSFLGLQKRGSLPVKDIGFPNGSWLHIRSAYHSADSVRGLSASMLVVDEFQDVASGILPILQETLSHASTPITLLAGTPKLVTNQLERYFAASTANEWVVRCGGCGDDVRVSEECLGDSGPVCPGCKSPVDFRQGRWVPGNPGSTWGEGFSIHAMMTPWKTYDQVRSARAHYHAEQFRNEVLGLPTDLGSLEITRDMLEACCRDRPQYGGRDDLPGWAHPTLVAGIDWGNGNDSSTSVVIGSLGPDDVFHVWRWSLLPPTRQREDTWQAVIRLCEQFGVTAVAADARGGGIRANRVLYDGLGRESAPPIIGIRYESSDGPRTKDGTIWSMGIDQAKWISGMFSRIRLRTIGLPTSPDNEIPFQHLLSVTASYNDIDRVITFVHPPDQPNDMVHALAYALVVGSSLAGRLSNYD